jgi:hypothetical protein
MNLDFSTVTRQPSAAPDADVLVSFLLPNAPTTPTTPHKFPKQATVDFLKVHVQKMHNVPYAGQTLYLHERPLPDPFSLVDVPAIKAAIDGAEVVTLVVELDDDDDDADDRDIGGGGDDGAIDSSGDAHDDGGGPVVDDEDDYDDDFDDFSDDDADDAV